jgi:2-dehydropantoate 2-reductase
MNLGEALANTDWKPKLFSAIAETCAVGNASGAQLDAQRVQAGFETAPPAMRSSMQKDVAARRPLELDSIGGPIVRGGERYGIDVSTTLQLMGAIRSKTRAA